MSQDESERPSGEGHQFAWWMGPLLICLSVAAGVVLAEVGLRLVWTNPFANEGSDVVVHLRLQHASRDLLLDRSYVDPERPTAHLRTDARHYILPSRRFESPDATVAFLGGSTTECSALDEAERFHAVVSDLFADRGLRVNALNAARAGNTTQDSLNVLLNHVVVDQPGVVMIMHAANDIAFGLRDPAYRSRMGRGVDLPLVSKWALQALSTRSSVFGAFRWKTFHEVEPRDFDQYAELARETADISPEPFAQRLHAFVRLARAFGIEPVLATQPSITMSHELTPGWMSARSQEIFNDRVRQVATDEDVVLVDLAVWVATAEPEWQEPMVVFYDGIHVTAQGARLYAQLISTKLADEVLPRVRARSARSVP